MRIHRIALRDFRGVEPLAVEFAPCGVTVVEGRNEMGKTSIIDAFMLLLDQKDSSGKRIVKETQPVGRDVGPSVEAELTVGPYRLVYRKQWLKNRKTELRIVAPEHEQLTGEEAHNRMLGLLDQETDPFLFRALRYQQGIAISQAEIADAPSLLASLDAAAGGKGALGGPGQEDLLTLVEKEFQRYFTEKGAVIGSRKRRTDELLQLRSDVETAEEKIGRLEQAAERVRRIEAELIELKAELPGVAERIGEGAKAMDAIREAEGRVERARHEREKAEAALREARAAGDGRRDLLASAESAAEVLVVLEGEIASAEPDLVAAEAAAAKAADACSAAAADAESAGRRDGDARRLVELFDLRLLRDQLDERHEHVDEADLAIEAAQRFLDGCALDEALVEKIDTAAAELAVARGRSESGRARLVVEPLRAVRLTVDGEATDGVRGAVVERVVSAEVEVVIDEVARVVVSPPTAAGELETALAGAESGLATLLGEGRVTSQGEAHELIRRRSQAEADLRHAMQRRGDALRDLEPAQLAGKLARAEQRLGELEPSLDPATEGVESAEEAHALAREATTQLEQARSREQQRQTDLAAAQSKLRVLEGKGIERRTRLEGAKAQAGRTAAELAAERAAVSDEELAKATGAAEEHGHAAAEEYEQAERSLDASDPDGTRMMLENDRGLQERLSGDIKAREIEGAEIGAELKLQQHEGLADRLAERRAKLEDLQREVNSENRRANAAERLRTVLAEKREQAQMTYIGPLRRKVNAYARILYGPGVDVAIDHSNFEIVNRTLNGTTVPFASLSGGAREQLAVLARLACGALVSPATEEGTPGGVPVIIDDALGYSDPDRLEKLGAAIGVAGREGQVIVLTCEPGRYRSVGGARVVSLEQRSASGEDSIESDGAPEARRAGDERSLMSPRS